MPIAVARLATAFLRTEKLQTQLEHGIGEKVEPLGRQFFRVSILADLGVDNFVSIAEKAESSLRHNEYVHHVFGRKLYEVAVRFRVERHKLPRLKSLVGSVFADVNNTKKAGTARSALMTGIDQQRFRIELEDKGSSKKSDQNDVNANWEKSSHLASLGHTLAGRHIGNQAHRNIQVDADYL